MWFTFFDIHIFFISYICSNNCAKYPWYISFAEQFFPCSKTPVHVSESFIIYLTFRDACSIFIKNYIGVILGHPKPSGDTQP